MFGFYFSRLVGSVRLGDPLRAATQLFDCDHLHKVIETLLGRPTETLDDLAAVRVSS
jgi:hypothetical protein